MKILYQAYGIGHGGGMENVLLLMKAYAKRFPLDEINLLCNDGSPLMQLSVYANCRIVTLPVDRWREFRRLWLNLVGMRRIAREMQADVIWSLNFGPYMRTGVPQVLSIHNAYQVYPWDITRFHPDPSWHVAAIRAFFRWALSTSDAVIAQTGLIAQLVSQLKSAPARVAVIPKAVETTEEVENKVLPNNRLAHDGVGEDRFTLLYVATAFPHKNHRLLIQMMEMLAHTGASVRLVVTISAEELRQVGGAVAEQLLESGHIVPVGWIAKEYLRALYDLSDCCVMPSLLESLSSSHLEAMQWERPQIAADLPYAHDLCGEAALYADPHDPAAWVAHILQLIDHAELRTALITAGKARMHQFPSTWSEVAERVHSLLQEVSISHAVKPGMLS